MSKPFAVFDIDGTIFRSSLLIEVVDALIQKGIFPPETSSKIGQLKQAWSNRASSSAYMDYLQQVIEVYLNNIAGVTEKQLDIVSDTVINAKHKQTYVFTRNLIEELRPTHHLFAISGSPSTLVERFVKIYKFDDFAATKYHTVDGIFDGTVTEASHGKDAILKTLVKKHKLSFKDSIAIGDTVGDIELLNAVENPQAFNPDAGLREVAISKNWPIIVERKSQVYKLEYFNGRYELA